MSHQMDSKNCGHGRYSFKHCGRNLLNRMMNRFESRWFIAIIGEVHHLVWKKRPITFVLVQQSKFPSITKKSQQNKMVSPDALCAVKAANQFYK